MHRGVIPIRISVTDYTTASDLDRYFTEAWHKCGHLKSKINFVFDVRQCRRVSLRKLLSVRPVLNKHRANSRAHIDHTSIVVSSKITKCMLSSGLAIIRTERPVKIVVSPMY